MGIDSSDCCYFKAMLGYDKLRNDICLSTASMSESEFSPKSTKTSNLNTQRPYQDSKLSIVKIHQKSEKGNIETENSPLHYFANVFLVENTVI